MAKLDDIKKELLAVVQKEIVQNEADQAQALAALETRRADMAEAIRTLNDMENGYLQLQETAMKLQQVIKEIEETLFDPYAAATVPMEGESIIATPEIRN